MNRYFPDHAAEFSKTLFAFWQDIADARDRVTLVTMTEFGRRLEENANGGTDHGSGAFMFVLGGGVRGGRMYGEWPGLKPRQLREGDLMVTMSQNYSLTQSPQSVPLVLTGDNQVLYQLSYSGLRRAASRLAGETRATLCPRVLKGKQSLSLFWPVSADATQTGRWRRHWIR